MSPALRPPQPIVWINGWPAVGKQALAQCLAQILGQDRAVVIDDREFTDQLNLPLDAQMARYVSRSGGDGRRRGMSLGELSHSHTYNVGGGDSGGAGECPGKECPGKECIGCECLGGRLITAQDGLSAPLQAKQEACFRKYVEDAESADGDKGGKGMQRVVIFTDCRANDAAGAEGAWRYADAAHKAGRPFVPIYVECLPEEHERRSQTSDRRYSQPDGGTISGAEAARELQALADGRLFTFPQDSVPGLFVNVTEQGTHDSAMEIISFINAVCEKRSIEVMASMMAAARRRPGSSYDSVAERKVS